MSEPVSLAELPQLADITAPIEPLPVDAAVAVGSRSLDGAVAAALAEAPAPSHPVAGDRRERSSRPAPDPHLSTVYRPSAHFDLAATVSVFSRGGDGPCFRRDSTGFWLTMRTPHGAATLWLRQRRGDGLGGEIDARAWGPGREWTIARVPHLLGAHDDWSALDVSRSPLLSEVLHRNPGIRLAAGGLVFEMLVPAIIEQKVTVVEAWGAWRRLVRRHGEAAPGPAPEGMFVAPDAEAWRFIPSWEWHAAGVDPRRSQTVVRASRVAEAIDRSADVDAGEAGRRLQSLPGIGVWTSAEVTLRAHGDPDAVSVGDYHLAATVGTALTGSAVDDDGMLELLAPWAGQRQRVLRLIERSGIRKPRRGPRITIQDHRRH
ncbi:DNA-3-methyladenine glycosylase family protein [Labedella phragmitis]|uniref:DNA-3-methyladenine glycosylase family protein n=1 Tax=Labedella phragmitis TaxID=2498849 RepID=UPI001AA01380|nr:DNA-3-methyladenine glycosylase 2 family protein [Labedella phragmitis]